MLDTTSSTFASMEWMDSGHEDKRYRLRVEFCLSFVLEGSEG